MIPYRCFVNVLSWNVGRELPLLAAWWVQKSVRGSRSAPMYYVQALRLCTGRTGHRGSRGITLLFLDHGTRRGWEVSVTPRPLFTPGKDRYLFYRRLGGPQGRSGQLRKFCAVLEGRIIIHFSKILYIVLHRTQLFPWGRSWKSSCVWMAELQAGKSAEIRCYLYGAYLYSLLFILFLQRVEGSHMPCWPAGFRGWRHSV